MKSGLDWEDEEEVITLYYSGDERCFIDDDGDVVSNILEYVTPNDLFLFHWHKSYCVFRHRSIPRTSIELMYPLEDDYYYDITDCHGYI